MTNLAQPFLMGKWANPAFTNQFRQALQNLPPATLAKRLISVLQVDVVDALKNLDVPVLYLRATKDRPIPEQMSWDFATELEQ
ncbi:hypothetical protein [Yoonia sp. BS5-3]|uniref:Alpha/beta fold hydrolase n=1 Tax=Yoonia phaeophyticola TaxID=3137369 RepID=A0ABZ2V8R1_9RHOB